LSIVRRLVEVHPDKKATRLLNAMINDGLHSRPTVD
jgi:hypothetical protein